MPQLDGQAWGVSDAAELVAEIDRDLADRLAHYPEQVRKGRLRREEAEYLTDLLRDIRADLLFEFRPLGAGEILDPIAHAPRVTWQNKVRWINGEIEHRKERLPELVAKGRIIQADADRRISAIEHLRRLYWNRMFQWEPPAGPARDYLDALHSAVRAGISTELLRHSEGRRVYLELVRTHMAAVALEENAQGELAA